MPHELIATAARLRRAMPRNADVLAVCDGLDRLVASRCHVTASPASRDTGSEPVASRDTGECPSRAERRASDAARQRKRRTTPSRA